MLAAALALLTACSTNGSPDSSTPDPSSTSLQSTPSAVPFEVPAQLETFTTTTVVLAFDDLGEATLVVAVADDRLERAQGLMDVTDLRDLDGMLFDFGEEVDAGFWMRDTPLPLTLLHFDEEGRFVSQVDMSPCPSEDCPSYFADGPFRYALEVPLGALTSVPSHISFEPMG